MESDSEEDTKETANMPVITLDTIVADNTIEKPMALNSVNHEEGNKGSNPRVKSHRTHIGKAEPVL